MRSQEEMLAIILKKAKQEEHIRAALLQGSRVSKEAKPDCFQDYDVVFLVDAMEPFLSNPRLDRLLWQTDHHADPRASYPDPNDLFDAVCRWKPY